jgi:hypothetical protein
VEVKAASTPGLVGACCFHPEVPGGMQRSSREQEGCGGAPAHVAHLRRGPTFWLSEPDRTDTGSISFILLGYINIFFKKY